MEKVDFSFKELDEEGLETLKAISDANKFNQWMFDTIKPHVHGKILEVGSGIGNISRYFLENGNLMYLSDIRENYRLFLKANFNHYNHLQEILDMNIVDPDFDAKFKHYFNYFDSIFALNVVEHIEDDKLAIYNISKLVKPGGNIIILVPAYQVLYNQLDKELYHFRRYNSEGLKKLFIDNNLSVTKFFNFNFSGILGWFISGKIQRNKIIPKNQMNIFNYLVPVFKVMDTIVSNKVGLSLICIGKK